MVSKALCEQNLLPRECVEAVQMKVSMSVPTTPHPKLRSKS